MVFTDNRLISLNSNYGTSLNGSMLSNVIFNFKGLLREDDDIINTTVCVLNAQIPCSFYNINNTNNILKIQYITTYTLTIPVGNYNANSLISQIISLCTLASSSIIPTSLTISPIDGKLSFQFSSGIILLYSGSTMAKVLGFNQDITGTSFILPYPLNLLGAKRLSIKSNYLSVSSYHSFNLGSTTTLTTIPIDQASFNMISFVNQNNLNSYTLTCKTIDTIDIQIYDEYNNLFDFNNVDWSVSVGLTIIRENQPKMNRNLSSYVSGNQPANSIQEKVSTEDELELEYLSRNI